MAMLLRVSITKIDRGNWSGRQRHRVTGNFSETDGWVLVRDRDIEQFAVDVTGFSRS